MQLDEVEIGLTYRIQVQTGWPADERRRAQEPHWEVITVEGSQATEIGGEPRRCVYGRTEDGRSLGVTFPPDHPVELIQPDDQCVCGENHDETSGHWLRPESRAEQLYAHEDCAKARGYTELA